MPLTECLIATPRPTKQITGEGVEAAAGGWQTSRRPNELVTAAATPHAGIRLDASPTDEPNEEHSQQSSTRKDMHLRNQRACSHVPTGRVRNTGRCDSCHVRK